MADFIYRSEEWEIDGALLCANIEVVLNWSWRNGEPTGFVPYTVTLLDKPRAYAPWIETAMAVWVAQNQAKLLKAFRDQPELYHSAEDAAWERQLRSTRPTIATHL